MSKLRYSYENQSEETGEKSFHARSSELLDLNELDEGFDLGLEGLGDKDTPVVTKLVAINDSTVVHHSHNLVIETKDAVLNFLIVSRSWEEATKGRLNVVVEGETIDNGEDPVEHAADLGGTGGQLLDLNAVLAGDVLVGQLNDEIVDVLDEDLNLRADSVEVEVVDNIVALGDNSVNEPVGLVNLLVAGGRGVGGVCLGAQGETEEGLPWLVIDAGLSDIVHGGSVRLA